MNNRIHTNITNNQPTFTMCADAVVCGKPRNGDPLS